jgi:hypothetical protein
MKPTILTSLLLAAGLACCSAGATAGTTLVQDVRVFDGKAAHEHRSVLVRDGVIVDADYRGKAPAGSRVVDGKGRTLLPGLIDAHVHAFQHFELPLVFGVTTQVDMFTAVPTMQKFSKAMLEGRNRDQAPNTRSPFPPWRTAATPRPSSMPASPKARISSRS